MVLETKTLTFPDIRFSIPAIVNEVKNSLGTDHIYRPEEILAKLSDYRDWMYYEDKDIIVAVKNHLDRFGADKNHTFDGHLETVAVMAAFAADIECDRKGITREGQSGLRKEIIQRAWRMGILHDLQRVRGYYTEEDHQLQSAYAAKQLINELNINDPYLFSMIAVHDELEVKSSGNPAVDVPFYSAFAADHFYWGWNMLGQWWHVAEVEKIPPEKAICYYDHLEDLLDGRNLEHTQFGRQIVLPSINFGLSVAKKIEERFSNLI